MNAKLATLSKHVTARMHNLGLGFVLPPLYEKSVRLAQYSLFSRLDFVTSLYLGQGTATGEGVQGLSDIDLVAIVAPATGKGQIEDLKRRFNRLSRIVPLFTKDELAVYNRDDLDEILSPSAPLHASLAKGQTAWRLIAGEDVLKRYSAVAEVDRPVLELEQLKIWIAHFYADLFGIKKRDAISRRYLWFKALAEILKFQAFVEDKDPVTRREALEVFKEAHPAYRKHKRVWDAAILMKAKTFASGSLPTAKERHALCVDLVSHSLEGLEKKLAKEKLAPLKFQATLGPGDLEISRSALSAISELANALAILGTKRVELSTRPFVGLDDLVLLVSLPGELGAEDFRNVYGFFDAFFATQNIFAYANYESNIGTAIYPVNANASESALISRLTDPLVFKAKWNVESFINDGVASRVSSGPSTIEFELPEPFASRLLRSARFERDAARRKVESLEPLDYDVIGFHRFFWKALQIDIWLSRVDSGLSPIEIPVVGSRILEEAKAAHGFCADFLDTFYGSYRKCLNDEISQSIELYGDALDALRRILFRSDAADGVR